MEGGDGSDSLAVAPSGQGQAGQKLNMLELRQQLQTQLKYKVRITGQTLNLVPCMHLHQVPIMTGELVIFKRLQPLQSWACRDARMQPC